MALERVCGPDDIIAGTTDGVCGRNNRVSLHLRPWAWWWRTKRNVCPFRTVQRSRFVTYYPHERAELIRDLVGRKAFESYFKFTIERNPWDREVSLYYWRTRKDRQIRFEDFVRANPKKFWVDNFDIYTIGGSLAADHVMRYENLKEEMAAVAQIIGCDPTLVALPHAKPRRVKQATYQQYYDDELRMIVEERYRREITLFNYRFEGTNA
jgi:Sulfotransferase family